ncbi:hypothetical protein niasHS_012104 [Heterodera schachtii]|uniref:Secreted protein n=1 Tax=Heterodera schachtii TaxID=97005 RepID=A0ABD2IDD8_HETSC
MGPILLLYFWLSFFRLVTEVRSWYYPVVTYELTRKDGTPTDGQKDEAQPAVESSQYNCYFVYCAIPFHYGANFNQNNGLGFHYGGYPYQSFTSHYPYYYGRR